jgi:hypothetical protein
VVPAFGCIDGRGVEFLIECINTGHVVQMVVVESEPIVGIEIGGQFVVGTSGTVGIENQTRIS